MTKKQGKVYLMGAGISDLDYLTVKATKILSQAEVLIYDALVDLSLLNLVPDNCLKIDIGKRGGKVSTSQNYINQLLVYYCQQGLIVARLKSGDPLIFGRINPEIEALTAANCNFELIPGISSALAAPLLAGIPLTDKIDSRCVAILTAHEPNTLDWQTLAKIDTLVILMGGRTLSVIVQRLQENGRSPNFPIAIIRNAGRKNQQIWRGILTDIVAKTAHLSLSPAIIVIGQVVNKQIMNYSNSLPLAGKKILITRAASQASNFRGMLEARGATVMEMPALEISPPSSWQELDQAIANLNSFNWLILTSANGVEYFLQRLRYLGKDVRSLAEVKIGVVGQKTANYLQKYRLKPDFIPPNFVADSLVSNFPETLINQKILFPRVETGGRELLVKELTKQGAKVSEVPAYQSGCPQQIDATAWQALENSTIDIITFASSKTVKNFYQLISLALNKSTKISPQSLLKHTKLASIGPETSQTCLKIFGKVDIQAEEYTLEGLTNAIVKAVISL
jgi:uroporphyrinogen III methyltransferase/synthase